MTNKVSDTSSDNSGVHTNVGMDFQKNCVVFLFLENYTDLKDKKYFIILEHLDDIVFGFLDSNDSLEKVETFQAKKSTSKWTLSGVLEVIKKITISGERILNDPHEKIEAFVQKNFFVTNNTIELKEKKSKSVVNETASVVQFSDLDDEIKVKILAGNDVIQFDDTDKSHVDNLSLKWIDFGKTTEAQKQQLIGKMMDVFDAEITDYKAALETFLFKLRKIESTFNQGNVARLKDSTKRIESSEIQELLSILTSKKKAYEFWRDNSDAICEAYQVSILDKTSFKLNYENSFDLFKDLNESEHRKILLFVEDSKHIFGEHINQMDCMRAFFEEFERTKSTTYQPLQLKAVLAAAYLEIQNSL